jgi:hypothetical protein
MDNELPALDYALLAEFASVRNGSLTVVGGSFTRFAASQFPGPIALSLCGRIRCHVSEPDPTLGVRFGPVSGEYAISLDAALTRDPDTQPYHEGRFGLLFAVNMQAILTAPGLHEVTIFLNGEQTRSLKFDAVQA